MSKPDYKIVMTLRRLMTVAVFLGACSAQAGDADRIETITDVSPAVRAPITLAANVPDTHQVIIEAFDLAAADSGATPEDLLEAAKRLTAYSAEPWSEETDRIKQWQARAVEQSPELAATIIPYRGRTKGPAYRTSALAPGESDVINEVFYAAETAQITLNIQDGSAENTGAVLRISQPKNAELICQEEAVGRNAVTCEWMPLFTALHAIEITNASDRDVNYLLISN